MSLFLDDISGALFAYSYKKLRASYSGSALRIRRTSDNAETDIGFDSNGHLDMASVDAFLVTGGSINYAHITTWYDQTGNGNHATQTSATRQPLVARKDTSGNFLVYGLTPIGTPSGAYFSGTDVMNLPSVYTQSTGFTTMYHVEFGSTFLESVVFNLSTATEKFSHSMRRTTVSELSSQHVDSSGSVATSSGANVFTGNYYAITDYLAPSLASLEAYYNNTLMTGTTDARNVYSVNVLGARNSSSYFTTGYIQSFIVFDSDKSGGAAQINSYWTGLLPNVWYLISNNVSSGSPVAGAPTLGIAALLPASSIITAPASVGSPSISVTANLSANSIAAGNPILGSPSFPTIIYNPVVPQTNIIVNGQKLHIFPDYKIGLSLNYSVGSIEGLESGISENFEVPFDDHNGGILGVNLASLSAGQRFDCQIEDEASNSIYDGYLEVMSVNVQTLYKSIELRFVDKVKKFVNTLKDTKLYELLNVNEFNHKFQLAKTNETFDGIELLDDENDFVQYVYTDYNNNDGFDVVGMHRYNEDFSNGDGIQHIQPAFKVNEFISRIETLTGETINSTFFSNTASGIDTDKMYFQFPMRYHGFDLSLREDTGQLLFNKYGYMLAGFPENPTNTTLNYLQRNKAFDSTFFRTSLNNFSIFREQNIGFGGQATGVLVLRSGTYKAEGTITIPEMNISLVDLGTSFSSSYVQGISDFTGTLTLNLGVIINDQPPVLIELHEYDRANFNTTSSSSVTDSGNTYYNFFKAAAQTVDYESQGIELSMGDRVSFVLVLNSSDALFTIGNKPSPASTVINQSQFKTIFDLSNSSGFNSLIFSFGAGINSMGNPFNFYGNSLLESWSDPSTMSHTATFSPTKEYPLCSIPQWTLDAFLNFSFDYEEVDLRENVKRFADISIYDLLVDIMGRFNMGAWYSHASDEFYIDVFTDYLQTATAQSIKPNFDNEETLVIDLQRGAVKSIALTNARGDSQTDEVLNSYAIGDYPQDVIDENEEIDLSYSSMFAVATGNNYGTEASLPTGLTQNDKLIRFASKNENLQVSQYGLRIGFLSDAKKAVIAMTPHPADYYFPMSSNPYPFVRYKAIQNGNFQIPTLQNIEETNQITIEFAIEDSGEMNPEPLSITTVYERFWKWYVDNLFDAVGFEGDFVFPKDEIKALSPMETYDFGYGDCIIESIDSFDLTQEKDKVRVTLRKI